MCIYARKHVRFSFHKRWFVCAIDMIIYMQASSPDQIPFYVCGRPVSSAELTQTRTRVVYSMHVCAQASVMFVSSAATPG